MIKRIYHLADIHVPTYKLLEMYGIELEKVVNSIREDFEASGLSSDEVRIVICGDVVDSKNIVTNELNVFVSTLIRSLSEIAQVLVIAGNHDLIESNVSRTDTLTGIFQTAMFSNAIFLDMVLDYKSGCYVDDNVTWAVYSFYDNFIAPDIDEAKNDSPDNIVIGLYHGTVVGTKLYNGTVSDSGNDSRIFEGCDYVMAGHIHKRQVLKTRTCEIVYPGSTVQKGFGETITQHGYAKWDINGKEASYEFVDIPTDHGYYDFTISSIDDIKNDKEILNNL